MLDFTCPSCGLESIEYSSIHPHGCCFMCGLEAIREFSFPTWADTDLTSDEIDDIIAREQAEAENY